MYFKVLKMYRNVWQLCYMYVLLDTKYQLYAVNGKKILIQTEELIYKQQDQNALKNNLPLLAIKIVLIFNSRLLNITELITSFSITTFSNVKFI